MADVVSCPAPDSVHGQVLIRQIKDELSERKPRKSVAFSDGATIVDSNGDVTEQANGHTSGDGNTAESHARELHWDRFTQLCFF
jgi:hypothetical protein